MSLDIEEFSRAHIAISCPPVAATRVFPTRSGSLPRVRAGARALARLEDLLSYPARDRMPCPVISGNTGMGKAMTIRKFLRDPPAAFDKAAGVTTMPVAALQMPAQPIERDIHGEWLVSFEIACWYDLCADDLSQRLGVEPHERPIGFSGRDFALTPAAASAWGSACRVSEEQVRDMALSTRRRPVGLYVWGEGGAVGAMRRPVCPACLDEDADAGLDHHIRRTWALVESCLCDRHGRFLSETCAHCPSLLGFRFRNRGGARLVCIQCQMAVRGVAAASDAASSGIQGFFRMLSSDFSESNDSFPSTASAALRAARLLWAPPRARGRTPYVARVASDVPCPPRTGAARDRSQPLATASLGWRMVTLLGVAQLLDLGVATPRSGSAPFTLDQLAEWTGEGRPESRARSARAAAIGPAPRMGGPVRAPEEYRRLAESILASEDWQNSRADPPATRRRTLGALMNRALG